MSHSKMRKRRNESEEWSQVGEKNNPQVCQNLILPLTWRSHFSAAPTESRNDASVLTRFLFLLRAKNTQKTHSLLAVLLIGSNLNSWLRGTERAVGDTHFHTLGKRPQSTEHKNDSLPRQEAFACSFQGVANWANYVFIKLFLSPARRVSERRTKWRRILPPFCKEQRCNQDVWLFPTA